MSAAAVLTNLAASAGLALLVVLIAFAVGVSKNRHRVIDIAWGTGFAAIAIASFIFSAGHGNLVQRLFVMALTVIWGVRLSVHIGWRSWGHDEDPRYSEMLDRSGSGNRKLRALRTIYLLQAAAMWFISLPVQLAFYSRNASVVSWLIAGTAVWAVGMFFETVGDAQLAKFRRDPTKHGRILDSGLWRYTRHPNYFGDACVWWGLYLLACTSWWGAATILSPVLMTYFLAGKTGKPLMDAYMSRTKPDYAAYLARTSGFIPLPPRKSTTSR